jgi:hypothetical protein
MTRCGVIFPQARSPSSSLTSRARPGSCTSSVPRATPRPWAFALTNPGFTVLEQGRLGDAASPLRASLAIHVDLMESSADAAIEALAAIVVARNDAATAARLLGQLGNGEGKSATYWRHSNQRFSTGPPRLPGSRSARPSRQVSRLAREQGARRRRPTGAIAAGDERRLRGIPAVLRGRAAPCSAPTR